MISKCVNEYKESINSGNITTKQNFDSWRDPCGNWNRSLGKSINLNIYYQIGSSRSYSPFYQYFENTDNGLKLFSVF